MHPVQVSPGAPRPFPTSVPSIPGGVCTAPGQRANLRGLAKAFREAHCFQATIKMPTATERANAVLAQAHASWLQDTVANRTGRLGHSLPLPS